MERDSSAREDPEQESDDDRLHRIWANFWMNDADGLIAGSRCMRLTRLRRGPWIEGRLHREDGRWVRMRFASRDEPTVELLLPGAVITHLTWEKDTDKRHSVQLMAADRVVLRASVAQWGFLKMSPDEGGMWLLTPQEQAAVVHAVEVVVARDAAKLAMIDPRWVENPEDLWEGADNYNADHPDYPDAVDLSSPTSPVEDWEAYVYRHADLSTWVHVPLYPADNDPFTWEDLNLSLWLTTGPDGVVQVVVEDLCTS